MGRAVQGRKVTSVSEDLGQPVLQGVAPSGCMELAQHCLWLSGHSALRLVPGDHVDGAPGHIAHLLSVLQNQGSSEEFGFPVTKN